jgi:hypothetical protein
MNPFDNSLIVIDEVQSYPYSGERYEKVALYNLILDARSELLCVVWIPGD